jgi:hypothetical protein
MPDMLPENEEAFKVWQLVNGQVVTAGMGEVIDISFPAVEIAMEALDVEDRKECFLKVVEISRTVIAAQNKKAKEESA